MFKESITPEEIASLPLASFPGTIHVISGNGPAYDKAIRYLRRQKVIGFDTETKPCFSAHQPHSDVGLLQLSGPEEAFLFRLNMLGLHHRRLRNILANPQIIKVGAAVQDDVRGLLRLHDFQAAGFVDLQKIGSRWGIQDKSVKKMAGIILGIRVSKAQQLSNWEADALSDAQALYAATDAWVCREMYLKLMETPTLEQETAATEESAGQ